MLLDLRESEQIEYDVNLIMFVHREEYCNPTEEKMLKDLYKYFGEKKVYYSKYVLWGGNDG